MPSGPPTPPEVGCVKRLRPEQLTMQETNGYVAARVPSVPTSSKFHAYPTKTLSAKGIIVGKLTRRPKQPAPAENHELAAVLAGICVRPTRAATVVGEPPNAV